MTRLARQITIVSFFLLTVILGCGKDSGAGGDNNDPPPGSENNKVRIDCPIDIAAPAQDTTIAIDVYITNDHDIGAFTLGFHYNSDDVEITDIIPGPALPEGTSSAASYYPGDNLVLFLWYDGSAANPIPAQEDVKVFTLVMTIPATVSPQEIDLDSAFVPPAGYFRFAFQPKGDVTPGLIDCGMADISIN
ncbi:MAG: hypothetical protein KAT58_08185 [candidate division Zixibacteria bacterium]|nr:hypothetical protein [candidate division Zixibacteria bacterium]